MIVLNFSVIFWNEREVRTSTTQHNPKPSPAGIKLPAAKGFLQNTGIFTP
jgi:hypothetical protein